MFLLRLFQLTDATALGVVLYFLVIGLQDRSVGPDNMHLWIGLVAVPLLALVGGTALFNRDRRGLGLLVLAIPAVPALAFAAFFGLLILSNPRWN